MSKDILSMYGKDSGSTQQVASSTCGGVTAAKDLPYSPPVGPKGQMHNSPGLGGTNHGNAVRQGKH